MVSSLCFLQGRIFPVISDTRKFSALFGSGRSGGIILNSVRWAMDHFEEAFSSVLIMIMSTFAFANVISRYVIDLSLNFTEELNVYFFVWLTFLGSAWAARVGGHMAVNILYDLFNKRFRLYLYLAIQVISVVFFVVLGFVGYVEVCDEVALHAMTETLVVPVWWFTGSIPIGSALCIFRTIQKTVEDLKERKY